MKKAAEGIASLVKRVDAAIEVLDARGIAATANPEVIGLFGQKPVLRVALKADLADLPRVGGGGAIVADIRDKNLRQRVLDGLNALMAAKRSRLAAKGLVSPLFNVAVVGLPNVGKSTLINVLGGKVRLKAENRPGVTRSVATVRVDQNFCVLDTPGVMVKKIGSFALGSALTLMGTIKPEAVPIHDVLGWGYEYLRVRYPRIPLFFAGAEAQDGYEAFLESAARKYGFVAARGKPDLDRAAQAFLRALGAGELGKVAYDI